MKMTTGRIAWNDAPARPGGAREMAPALAMAFSVLIHGGLIAMAGRMPPPAFSPPPGLSARDTIDVRLVPGAKPPPVQTAQPPIQPQTQVQAVQPVKKPAVKKTVPRKLAAKPAPKPPAKPSARPPIRRQLAKAPPTPSAASLSDEPRGASRLDTSSPNPAALAWIMAHLRKNLVYPRQARRRGWEGQALLGFQLVDDGRIEKIQLARSSGRPLLDRAALKALGKIRSIPAGKGWRARRHMDVTIPVVFRLTE